MIRNSPLFLNLWSPNVNLSKEDHTSVPMWVKLHDIPILGFTEDGLSVIASRVGGPLMLDTYTSSICSDAWGKPSYARAMIEINADKALKDKVVVATPCLDRGGKFTKDVASIEYEWKPPKCTECRVFGHLDASCPLNVSIFIEKKS